VLRGLRHLDRSGEPARVFTELAGVCVPALCDECVIWISEQQQHPYRIRRAGPAVPAGATAIPRGLLTTAPGNGTTILNGSAAGAATVEIADHAVIARFVNSPWGGPDYRGVLVGRWHTAHTPDDAEAALIGVMVDHATALVQRERAAAGAPAGHIEHLGTALSATQRIAAASGILMFLHHLSATQARSLLNRASEHTHRPVIDIADTVLRTGALPPQTRDPATGHLDPSPRDLQQTPLVPLPGRP
jgi:hypothetical protein